MSPPRKKPQSEVAELERRFEGRARLQTLLEKAGVVADVEDVAEAFRAAQKDDLPPATVINALFEDEPQFPSPKDARALFGNLFGLWELLETGADVDLKAPTPRAKAPPPPTAPTFFPKEGPDDAWVERAWRYLDVAPPKEHQKLRHAYEHPLQRAAGESRPTGP